MITPHVIKNRSQADQITREFSQKVADLQAGGKTKKIVSFRRLHTIHEINCAYNESRFP